MSLLVGYISVSVVRMGTVEWKVVGLFSAQGVAAADVVSTYILVRAILLGAGFVTFIVLHSHAMPRVSADAAS